MDIRLKFDKCMVICGPSGSGKTHFCIKLLKNRKNLFNYPLNKIYWHYGAEDGENGETLTELKKLKNISFNKGFPEGWANKPKKFDCVVVDDLFSEATKEPDLVKFFTKIARHRGVFLIFLTQNLFHQGGQHRTRNLNTHYLVLFKNPRDKTVIDFLARQMYPRGRNFLIDAFEDATKNTPHGYLFFDFTQDCPEELRIRSDIFGQHIVYKQVNI